MLVPFDLLIRNGHIIDPAQNINGIADVGIREGRIQAIGPALDATGCKDIRDASGTYIAPAWWTCTAIGTKAGSTELTRRSA